MRSMDAVQFESPEFAVIVATVVVPSRNWTVPESLALATDRAEPPSPVSRLVVPDAEHDTKSTRVPVYPEPRHAQ